MDKITEEDEFLSDAINLKNLRYGDIVEAFQRKFKTSEDEAERRVDLPIERNAW